jgi:dipeptidyl aminopeptidase/acylaminoacyl peptidase
MKKITLSLTFLLTLATGFSQKKFTPEDIWRLAMVTDPQPSPDGKNILFHMKRTELAENKGNNDLFIVNSEGEGTIQITSTPSSEFNARWRPDGTKIGFLMAEGGAPQFYEINPDGSGLEKISNEASGIEGFEYSPKGDHLLFFKSTQVQKPDAQLFKDLPKATGRIYDGLLFRHWMDWADGSYNHVFVQAYQNGELIGKPVDLLQGEAWDAPLKPMGGIEQITWRPDGKAIAYTCKKKTGTADATSTNSDIYLFDLETKSTKNLTEGMMGYDIEPRFSPDGKKIAWQSMARDGYEADKNRLMVKDLKTGQVTEATQNYDITIKSQVWSSNSQLIYFEVQTQGTVQIYEWDSRKQPAKSIEPVTAGQHNYTSLALFRNGKQDYLIGTKQSINTPNEIWKIDPIEEKEQPITKLNAEVLSEFKLCKVEKRMVKASDGKEILTWVVYPPDFNPSKKYPAVLMCQGGPQSMVGQNFSTRWNFQLMASQGYIMVLPNRRGVPGFGQEWNEQISGKWGEQAMTDLISVTDDICKEMYVDKDKLAAVGGSFGGYSVYWLAGHHQKRFKAFIAHCGVFNLESMYGATEEIWFSNWDMKGPYWQEPQPESYFKYSPHHFVKNWDTPMLVIHNDKDFRVPITEGLQAFTAAQLRNIPSRFLFFPDEGHWVQKPQNAVLWNRVFFDWLGRYLK